MNLVTRAGLLLTIGAGLLAGCKTTEDSQKGDPWQPVEAASFPIDLAAAKLQSPRRAAFAMAVPRREMRRPSSYNIYRYRLRAPGRLLDYFYAALHPGLGWNEPDTIANWVRDSLGGTPGAAPGDSGSFGSEFGSRVEYQAYTRGAFHCLALRSYYGEPGGDNRLVGTHLVRGRYCGPAEEVMDEALAREIAGALVIKVS